MKIMKKLVINTAVSVMIAMGSPLQASISAAQINLAKASYKTNLVPVAIIGAGPAGLSAAIYTARAQLPTYVFAGDNLGGHLNDIQQIENFPASPRTSGEALAKKLEEQAAGFGAHFVQDSITAINFNKYPFELTTSKGDVVHALSVVIATGFTQEKLDIPGTEKYWGNGIGICTICDAPFALDQEVVVIGDDDFAAERVVQLAAFAKKVMMITRKNELNVTPKVLDDLRALHDKVEIITGEAVLEILGDGSHATGVRLRNVQTKAERNIAASTVYLNSVYKPESNLFKGQVPLDTEGYIERKKDSQATLVPGIFCAGAVTNKPNKAGPSAGFGMAAGVEVIEFMHKTVGFTPVISKQFEKLCYAVEQKRSLSNISHASKKGQFTEILKKKPITILFAYLPGCRFCKAMFPEMVEIAQEFKDKVTLVKLNANQSSELADSLNFDSVPTTFIYKDGVLVHTIRGKTNKQAVMNILKSIIAQMNVTADEEPSPKAMAAG